MDAAAAVALVAVVLYTHDVRSMIRAGYWLDEAWVAMSVRLPLSDLPTVTASTPIGWTLLLRLVPDPNDLRVVPLAFLIFAVLAAYALGRSLGWATRWHGVLAGAAAAVAAVILPAAHVRHDLKQYTADAAVALILLTLVSRVEGRWSRPRLAALAGCTAFGMLLSHATMIVGACGLGALVITELVRRRWRRLVEASVTGVVSGAAALGIYLGITTRGRNSSLEDYWAAFFPEPNRLWAYLDAHLATLQPYLGIPWPLLLALAALGAVVLARTGRPATALAAALVPAAMVLLGLAKAYPLLDLRTSHFLLVLLAALAAIGVTGAAVALARAAPAPAGPHRWFATAVALAVVAGAAAGYGYTNRQWLKRESAPARAALPNDHVRDAVRYLLTHREPGDVILVNSTSVYGFAFYWTPDKAVREPAPQYAIGWWPAYQPGTGIVLLGRRTPEAILAGLARADELARQPGATGRIWLIRSNVRREERQIWTELLPADTVEATLLGEQVLVSLSPKDTAAARTQWTVRAPAHAAPATGSPQPRPR